MKPEEIGERIKRLRIKKGMSLQDIADKLDVNRSSVMRWEKGETAKIKLPVAEKLADLLGTSAQYLIYGDDEEAWIKKNEVVHGDFCYLPLLGCVCAGNGLMAEENILRFEVADRKYANGDYFYLRVSGDSMSPKLDDGDLVLVKKQTSVDNGEVGVFLIDGTDGVVKKVKYDRNYIELHSFNPYYPLLRFEGKDVLRVRVIGKIVESKRVW